VGVSVASPFIVENHGINLMKVNTEEDEGYTTD
jgi:hypothetical protein